VAAVLLQMDHTTRNRILRGMEFYMEQTRSRLLSTFEAASMEDEARSYAEAKFRSLGRNFDLDHHDVADFAGAAWEAAADFHLQLINMRRETMLSIVAGMYHTWERQLREWLVSEFDQSFDMRDLRPALWGKTTADLFALMSGLGIDLNNQAFYPTIDECRLVVNVYKHAEGNSFDDLKLRQPRYLSTTRPDGTLSSHTAPWNLEVSEADIAAFNAAIREFWRFLPENVSWPTEGIVPDWFGKAVTKAR
jgi:hypothetical protein